MPGRAARLFCLHLGTIVGPLTYLILAGAAGRQSPAFERALTTGFLVHTAYAVLAWRAGEAKTFDLTIWLWLAFGWLAAMLGLAPVVEVYRRYPEAQMFLAFAAGAFVPLAIGAAPFTLHYARRQLPAWQLRMPGIDGLLRVLAAFWGFLFLTAAALCAARPADPTFTVVLPNVLIFIVGMPANTWLPLLYFRLVPQPPPHEIEGLILAMPMLFDRKAAGATQATIQFEVSGAEAGSWWVQIANGRCKGAAGRRPTPDLTIRTPDAVWRRITHGELDGGLALQDGLYAIEGDLGLLARFPVLFPARRPAA